MSKSKNSSIELIIVMACVLLFSGCASYNPNGEYNSQGTKPKPENLVIPPGLNAPKTNSNYQIINQPDNNAKYQLNQIKGMRIEQGGSERWLVIESRTVDNMWPVMAGFLSQLGLSIKYQNKNVGVIQTDWATRNSDVSQTGVRAFFQWIGWGEMYNMPTQYSFRITLWQNGNNVQIFVTDIQMSEVYPGCGKSLNSSIETSDKQITRWMPIPPNPQLELEFLMQFMAFSGLTSEQIKTVRAEVKKESDTALESVTAVKGEIIINDTFDRSWWRVAVAMDRVGLGVSDKNRELGEYYVYPMQSQVNAPEDGFFSKMFGWGNGTSLKIPDAKYVIKLTSAGATTILIIKPINGKVVTGEEAEINKYLNSLAKQLY